MLRSLSSERPIVVTCLWTLYSRGPPCGGKYLRVGIEPLDPSPAVAVCLQAMPNGRSVRILEKQAGNLKPHSAGHGHEPAARDTDGSVLALSEESGPVVHGRIFRIHGEHAAGAVAEKRRSPH